MMKRVLVVIVWLLLLAPLKALAVSMAEYAVLLFVIVVSLLPRVAVLPQGRTKCSINSIRPSSLPKPLTPPAIRSRN